MGGLRSDIYASNFLFSWDVSLASPSPPPKQFTVKLAAAQLKEKRRKTKQEEEEEEEEDCLYMEIYVVP
jgi:carboxylesterase type B